MTSERDGTVDISALKAAAEKREGSSPSARTIVEKCLHCNHEFCLNCGLVMQETIAKEIQTSVITGLACCKCQTRLVCEPYVVYSGLSAIYAGLKNKLLYGNYNIDEQKPNHDATFEGEKEKQNAPYA